jgi:colanic acid/amylovoran biosynthesis protein
MNTVRRILYLGTVVSNGGDAAIQRAQMAVLDDALGVPLTAMHDNNPPVARRLFPTAEVHAPVYQRVNRPNGMGLLARVLRRANKERVHLAARWWRGRSGLPGRAFILPSEAEGLRSIARADVVAYTGGTSLIEKYSVRGKLYEVDLALAMGKPVVMLPQSLGPFHDVANQAAVRKTLERVAAIYLRDERSLRFLREIGLGTDRVRVVPDIVFALQDGNTARRLAQWSFPRDEPKIAISVRDCAVFFEGDEHLRRQRDRDFQEAVAALTTVLVREYGARVTFVSTCQGVPEYWTDDSEVALSVAQRLPADVRARVHVDRDYHDTRELIALFSSFDLVVATRLHAAILALDAGTPVLPIAYEFKTEEVMTQLGLERYVVTIARATETTLVEALSRLLAELPGLRRGIAEKLMTVGQEARNVGTLVLEAVHENGTPK